MDAPRRRRVRSIVTASPRGTRLPRRQTRGRRRGEAVSTNRFSRSQISLLRTTSRSIVGATGLRCCPRRIRQSRWKLSHRIRETGFDRQWFDVRSSTRRRFANRGGRLRLRVRSMARAAFSRGSRRPDPGDAAGDLLLRNSSRVGSLSARPSSDLDRFRRANRLRPSRCPWSRVQACRRYAR